MPLFFRRPETMHHKTLSSNPAAWARYLVNTNPKNNLLIRQLNVEHFQMPANKPLACCPLPREREQVSAAGKRM
jgi:hypothetical protein